LLVLLIVKVECVVDVSRPAAFIITAG